MNITQTCRQEATKGSSNLAAGPCMSSLAPRRVDTLFVGVFDPHHYPRLCRHGSIDEQRGVHSLPRTTTDGVHGQGRTNWNRKGTCTVPATCRQRGQRRKLICHTSLLVYVATVPHFFSGTPPFFAHPSTNTNNTVNRVNVRSWRKLRVNSSITPRVEPCKEYGRSFGKRESYPKVLLPCHMYLLHVRPCIRGAHPTVRANLNVNSPIPFLVFPHRQPWMSSRMGKVRAR